MTHLNADVNVSAVVFQGGGEQAGEGGRGGAGEQDT